MTTAPSSTPRTVTPLAPAHGVAYGPGGCSVQWEIVTPELAALMLEGNRDNRSLRPDAVDQYSRDMLANNWRIIPSGPGQDQNGELLDGQHRLEAVVKAGVPVGMWVFQGIPKPNRVAIDTGMPRNVADYLSWTGEVNAAQTGAVVRLAMVLDRNGGNAVGRQTLKVSHQEVFDYLQANPGIRRGVRVAYNTRGLLGSGTARGYASWKLSEIDEGLADEFLYSCADAQGWGHNDPRKALSKRFTDAKIGKERIPLPVQVGMFFRAWNAWMKKEELKYIRTVSDGKATQIPTLIHPAGK